MPRTSSLTTSAGEADISDEALRRKIAAFVGSHGVSLAQIADAADVQRPNIYMLMQGKPQVFSQARKQRILAAIHDPNAIEFAIDNLHTQVLSLMASLNGAELSPTNVCKLREINEAILGPLESLPATPGKRSIGP